MSKQSEIEKINSCIGELVYEKTQLRKAYNYYHCNRDAEQFRHIEENFGIGTPTSVGFTPLIKKHIDVLVGEYLELDPSLQVTCKDEKTLSDIMRDKQLKIDKAVFDRFKQKLENAIVQVFLQDQEAPNDPFFEQELEKLRRDISESYVSEYEIAAQNILNFIRNSRDIDLKNKMRELFTDILIGGVAYYRTKPQGNGMKLEILNPLDTFIERNHNEFYLNKSPRVCVRRWMTKDQILVEFRDELDSEAKALLEKDSWRSRQHTGHIYVRAVDSSCIDGMPRVTPTPGILGGLEVHPLRDGLDNAYLTTNETYPVYECEWLEWNDDKLTRHEGVRIGAEIYITRGESETVTRSISDPKNCTLSVNGIFFNDRNGDPFSLMINTMDMQD